LNKDEGILKIIKQKKKEEIRLIVSFMEKHDKKAAMNMLRSYGVPIIPDYLLEVALSHELKENLVSFLAVILSL